MTETFLELYNYDGHHKYMRKIVEELNELSCALSHYQDEKIGSYMLVNEYVDVLMQLDKLIFYFEEIVQDSTFNQDNIELLYEQKINYLKQMLSHNKSS